MRRAPQLLYLAGAALVVVNLALLDLEATVLAGFLAVPLLLRGNRATSYIVAVVGAFVVIFGIVGIMLLPLWIPAGILVMASALLTLRTQRLGRTD